MSSKVRQQKPAKKDEELEEEVIDDVDDNESIFDEEEGEDDAQPDESKGGDDDEEEEEEEEDDGTQERPAAKRRMHVYHQVPESTDIKIVAPANRITSEYMTIYEYSMVVGTRATHISKGSILYTDPQGLFDPRDIAKKEIAENKCPLSITRRVSPSMVEVWEVNEMIKPQM